MGGKSGNVMRLPLRERARIDPVRVLKLRRELGHAGAAVVMQHRVEAITAALIRMEAMRGPDRSPEEAESFRRSGQRLGRLAAEVGLVRVARVAEDVVHLSRDGDPTAFAAAWARLLRLCAAALGAETGIRHGRV